MEITHNKPQTGRFPTGRLWVLFGKPKVGKSTFAATWDRPIIFDLENGTTEIECDVVKPENVAELRKFLKDRQLKNYDTLIIDTFDVVYSMLENEVIDRMNRQLKTRYTYIGEFPMGAGWANAKNAVKSFILKDLTPLMRKDKNVVLILHEKTETIKRKGEDEITTYNIALPGQTATLVCSMADVIGRCYLKKDTPFISFSPARDLGGSRVKSLAGKEIPLNFDIMKKLTESGKPKDPKGITEIVDEQEEDDGW